MKLFITLCISVFSLTALAQATPEVIAQNKDWSAFKETSEFLGKNVCVASTQMIDSTNGTVSELSVIKIVNADGTMSSPFVMVTSTSATAVFYKGTVKTNSSKTYTMDLLQGTNNQVGLIAKYADMGAIISAFKAHNTMKVDFSAKASVLNLPFSLSGSSKTINAMEEACK